MKRFGCETLLTPQAHGEGGPVVRLSGPPGVLKRVQIPPSVVNTNTRWPRAWTGQR